MKKIFLFILLLISLQKETSALIINEIMSNPVGDDGGREWIEVYNNSSSTVDLSSLSISVKGGAAVPATLLSGALTIEGGGYAIIGTVVTGFTKFSQEYPLYNGSLFKSSISLVNTGVTSLEIKLGGITSDTISSYTAAKEGMTYSRIGSTFSVANPTPGAENQPTVEDAASPASNSAVTSQLTISQASLPSSDIVLYLPQERTVVAGAESPFSVFGLTLSGKSIDRLVYTWAYGDGGQGTGSSTSYRYAYPGRYIATVEGGNGAVLGTGRISVRVVAPDISIKNIGTGKYGTYIDIENPNSYELDLSQWRLVIDGASFLFPKNTFIAGNNVTHITGSAMGFASTTFASTTIVKILFPNLEEITRYSFQKSEESSVSSQVSTSSVSTLGNLKTNSMKVVTAPKKKIVTVVPAVSSSSKNNSDKKYATTTKNESKRDTRAAGFLKSIFGRK